MDAQQFDTVVKAVGNRTTRRGIVGVLAAGIGSGALLARATPGAAKGRRCPNPRERPCGPHDCYDLDQEICCHCPGGTILIVLNPTESCKVLCSI